MVQLRKFIFNPFQENTYILWDEGTCEATIVDPGCYKKEEEEDLFNFIENNNLNVKYLINTHCHIDHILGNKSVKDKYKCEFFAPEFDIPLLKNSPKQGEMFGIKVIPSPLPDKYITEDLMLYLGNSSMKFLFTPGHTPGEYCILLANEKICISGDVLFLESIGRTDLWGGDFNTLIKSINEKLFTQEDDVKVYPGHGDDTSIGYEKKNNPFLN